MRLASKGQHPLSLPIATDLGLAVVDRYTKRFGAALDAIAANAKRSFLAMLDRYVAPSSNSRGRPTRCACAVRWPAG